MCITCAPSYEIQCTKSSKSPYMWENLTKSELTGGICECGAHELLKSIETHWIIELHFWPNNTVSSPADLSNKLKDFYWISRMELFEISIISISNLAIIFYYTWFNAPH